ncbi:hypothetical protein [Terriglobus roseus]|uniref:Uncharacterized protein n=1 Tax=Terriglobus roseus TaxID=392734 RepID=A0A1G7JVI8_9BACT|nr:hypothetical protein [Terriglobus roseus]SDF28844.1 hypothetical protein SAMN05444167_1960 [Terriglobus roseus]
MGKPPISDAAMRKMYETMKALRSAKRDTSTWTGVARNVKAAATAEPESLLAGILSQLHRRDTVVTAGELPLLKTAVESYFPISVASLHTVVCNGSTEECASVAAGMALRSMDATRDPKPVTVVLLQDFPALLGTLKLMESNDLPLLVIAKGEAESRAIAEKRMKSTQVPILPVDAADAVAVCRVMQESLLRARNGWGGSVIHAIAVPGASDSVAGMEERLRARGLV